ncbi:MAG: hypothetical protein R6U29_10535 [Desulfosudaceae bacterium]
MMKQLFHAGRWQGYRVIGVLVVAMIIIIGGSNPVAAADPAEEEEVKGRSFTADIIAKRPDYIVAQDDKGRQQRLTVSSETMIRKADGTRTALEYLIVPCKARVETYGPRAKNRGAREIEVMATSPTGTSHWSTPPPE